MVSYNKKLTAVDIFSGCGGITQALKNAGFKLLFGIEYDNKIAKSYMLNHRSKLIIKDIQEVNSNDITSDLEPGELDLLAGCPPCQGFSGQNRGKKDNDKRNYLIFHYYRMVRILKPKYIFLENVPGIMGHSYIFRTLLNLLDDGGSRKNRPEYYVHYDVVNAKDYGVPQNRNRFVLVGIRKDIALGQDEVKKIYAEPTHMDPQHWTPKSGKQKWITIYEAIGHLYPINAGETSIEDVLHRAASLSELNMHRIKNTPHNGGNRCDWPESIETDDGRKFDLWLNCHKKQGIRFDDVYGRMSFSKVAPTITGGCATLSKGRFGHPVQDRAISLREAALLQTFPPNYKFHGSFNSIALQIGNAVPVKMGTEFFKKIKVYEYKRRKDNI